VSIVPNSQKSEVEYYVYKVDASEIRIPKEDILHIKYYNPLNDWYGLSPLQVAIHSIDQHNAISKHNLSLMQNGGRPSGCLILKGGMENMTDEQREKLRADVRHVYSGTANAGKIMVLEGSFEWKDMGLSPKDLDFTSGKNVTSREIALTFGVPPELLGIDCNASFINKKEARLHLWEDTILPLAERIRQDLNYWLQKKFDCNCKIMLDLDAIPALTAKREILWNKISDATFLTQNEKRKLLGFHPLDDWCSGDGQESKGTQCDA
jgi:HK97 family phage portal protein